MSRPRAWAVVGGALLGCGMTAKFGPAGAAIFVGVLFVAWATLSEIEKVRRDNENRR